jgi:ATP-dependent Clp protease adaptor protein ClpS
MTKIVPIKDSQKQDLKPPPMYKVMFNNDDYTPMEFVVEVLRRFFNHDETTATVIMMIVHDRGKASAGHFTKEVAEMKVEIVNSLARSHGYPLMLTYEEA